MAKMVNEHELAKIVNKLLTDPTGSGQLDEMSAMENFMTDIAKVVCDYCGGEVLNDASFNPSAEHGYNYLVGIHGNDSLAEDGGIWKEVDPEGEL